MADPLSLNRFKNVEFASCTYQAIVPSGVTLKDVLDPSFWAHISTEIDQRFRNHRIEVISEDGSLDVDLRVLKVSERSVSVRVLRVAPDLAEVSIATPAKELPRYEFVPGRGNGWRILDVTGHVYADRIEGKEKAQQLFEQYCAEARIAA